MSKDDKKFEVEESYNKENPFSIGKILASILFIFIGGFLVVRVFTVYKNVAIPALIILATGFILLTIWHKGLYIYRYMLPAMIIILVFTAYPIVYTIYIAFTNFGTGHMFSKEKTKEKLLTEQWETNYAYPALFAEFYAPKGQVDEYMKAYKKAYDDFSKKVEKWEKQKKSEDYIYEMKDIEFYGKKIPELTSNYLDKKIKLEDVTIILYSQNKVTKNSPNKSNVIEVDAEETLYDSSGNEVAEVYETYSETLPPLKIYVSEGTTQLKELSLDEVDKYTKGKKLLGNKVYDREGVEEATDEDYELFVDIRDINNVFEGLKDLTPLVIGDSNYLIETSNQFLSKMHSFRIDPDNKQKMQKLNRETFVYDKENTVYEDSKQGRFVLTKDAEPVKFWKEYYLSKLEFDYGLLNLETDSVVETYLSDHFRKTTGVESQIGELDLDGIINTPINMVDKAKLNSVNSKLKEINKEITKFNKGRNEYRKEFLQLQKSRIDSEYPDLPDSIDAEVMNKKILEKITAKAIDENQGNQDKNYLLFYYRVGITSTNTYTLQQDKIDVANEEVYRSLKKRLWDLLDTSGVYNLNKEKDKRKNALNSQKFPKYADIKLVQFENSNIDEYTSIEPGYSIWIGAKNFQKIVSSKNITAPFLFVFLWTVAWAAFSVLTSFALGLALALVFNASDFKGKYFYRTLFILPYAIPSFVTILMWSGFLNKDFGVINNFFNINVPWLMDGWLAKISTLTVNLWLSFPYFMIISLGALQSIDSSMYEAADVDGATKVQQFGMITLPLLLMALGPMLVGSFAFAFNNFGGIYLLTGGGPTMAAGVLPGHTDILISYTYKLAFGEQNKDYGLASAIAIIVFLIIGTLTFLQFKFTGTFKEVDNA